MAKVVVTDYTCDLHAFRQDFDVPATMTITCRFDGDVWRTVDVCDDDYTIVEPFIIASRTQGHPVGAGVKPMVRDVSNAEPKTKRRRRKRDPETGELMPLPA